MPPGINWPGQGGITLDDASTWGPMLAVAAGFIVVWCAMAGLTGWLAGRKNREGGLWVLLGLLTGPIALLAICLLKTAPTED